MEGDANDNSQDVDEENHVKSISLHTLFEQQCNADAMPILEFCPSKIRNDSFNLDNQPRLNHMNNTIRHVQNRVTAMKPCYGKFLENQFNTLKPYLLVNWLKTGTWDYYAPARRKLVRETLVLKRKRTDDEIFADFKRRKAEKDGQSKLELGDKIKRTSKRFTTSSSSCSMSLIASLRRRGRSKDS